jgi:Protein of unknown function (DUF3011)
MINLRSLLHVCCAVAVVFVLGQHGSAQVINCSSNDMHRQYCAADTRGGVQLVKQHSDAACRQGYSWDYDRGGIWVDHGCRADFAIQQDSGRDHRRSDQPDTTITCSSDDGHRHVCPAYVRGGVRLVNQRSGSPCQKGYSWGADQQGIWVDHGCRADFALEQGDRDHDRDYDRDHDRDPGGVSTVNCSSDDMHRHYCAVDTRGGVRLIKQRSDARCQQGYSWGYDRQGIWVDRGCRADFEVGR